MKIRQPHITKDQVQAYYACAVLWMIRLAAFVLRWTNLRESRTLKRIVRRQERFIGHVLFLTAALRIGHAPRRQRRLRPGPGFRRVYGHIHLLIKSARIGKRRAGIRARVLHLLDVLANPERVIAHFIMRLRRRICLQRLIATAPAAVALVTGAPCDIAIADSS